jgi:hypothetical protein
MKKYIKLEPIPQTGHNCKPTAIAAVDKYFANQLGFMPIPLHKKSIAPISVRQLAKTKGSVQGELLEIRQLSEIFTDLGYKTALVDVQDNFDLFKRTVTENINKGNLIIACFAANPLTETPHHYNLEHDNEHAAVLHGFDEITDVLHFTHWDKNRQTTMHDFYNSSMSLPTQRKPEYYKNVKHQKHDMKYDLIADQTGLLLPSGVSVKKSLVPTANSGFRGKLLVINQPQLQNISAARNKFLFSHHKQIILDLLKDINKEINELINKSKDFAEYQEVGKIALKLNDQLNGAAKKFFNGKLTIDEFKHKCHTAIEDAAPELAKHRGWHQINSSLRTFLGILAILFIVPAIVVELSTKDGFAGTFFKTPKTDTLDKMDLFMENLNQMNML